MTKKNVKKKSMDLTKRHGVEPGWPLSWLYVIREGDGQKAIYNSVEEAETGN